MNKPRFQISLAGIFVATLVTSLTLGYWAHYRDGTAYLVAGTSVAFLFGALTRFPYVGVLVASLAQMLLVALDDRESEAEFVVAAPLVVAMQAPILIAAAMIGWAFHGPILRMGQNQDKTEP